jgi:PKD repeat protein
MQYNDVVNMVEGIASALGVQFFHGRNYDTTLEFGNNYPQIHLFPFQQTNVNENILRNDLLIGFFDIDGHENTMQQRQQIIASMWAVAAQFEQAARQVSGIQVISIVREPQYLQMMGVMSGVALRFVFNSGVGCGDPFVLCQPATINLNSNPFLQVISGGFANITLVDENGDPITPLSVTGTQIEIQGSTGPCADATAELFFDNELIDSIQIPSNATGGFSIDCNTPLDFAVRVESTQLSHQHTGTFKEDGQINGKPKYVKIGDTDRFISYNGTQWQLEKIGGGAHVHLAAPGNEQYPWEANWTDAYLTVTQATIGTYCSNGGNAFYVLKDSAGNVLETGSIAPGATKDITAPDATYNLDNTDGSTLFLGSILSGDNETIIAPDGAVNNSDTTYTALVASGGVLALPDQTIEVNTVNEGSIPSVGTIEIDITDGVNPVTPDSVDITGRKVTIEVPTMDVDFSADKLVADLGETITFTDLTNNSPVIWSWRFGSEGVSIAQNPTFSFFTSGFKNITLLAGKVGAGGVEIKSSYIEILVPLLLDVFPNAAAAYSLRKLRAAYTGSAIRVRRSSDNTEQDIGFNGSNGLDTTALLAFVGAGNGFVSTWYDQSGNGSDVTQTSSANQPQIVSSGSVITENGNPSVLFDGTNDFLNRTQTASNIFAANHSLFSVNKATGGSLRKCILESTSSTSNLFNPSVEYNGNLPNNIRMFSGDGAANTLTTSTNTFGNSQLILSALKNGTTIQELFVNNVFQGSTVPAITPTVQITGYNIGTFRSANDRFFGGNMQELVLYNSYESSNRSAIENNIMNYYGI